MKNNKIVIMGVIILVICIICLVFFMIKSKKISNTSIKDDNNNSRINNTTSLNEVNNSEEDDNLKINIIINGYIFTSNLIDNETSRKFISLLPLEIEMNELNKNEKYSYLKESLPINPYKLNKINKGDLMIYESNCLVLFYESFNTSYNYTKLGTITNTDKLKQAIGKGNIKVKIEKY